MILLTSVSTRRKELLQQIGFRVGKDFIQDFGPVPFNFHEDKEKLTLDEVKEKALEVARRKIITAVVNQGLLEIHELPAKETVVVGADTVVLFKGRVLDRPLLVNPNNVTEYLKNQAQEQARCMLCDLAGQDFFVITAVVCAQGNNLHNERSCCIVTEARMKQFSDNEVERYIRTGEPLDKAGGFGIQERGVVLFEKIKGSYSNVVGLPLAEFIELLRDPLFEGRVQFPFNQKDEQKRESITEGAPALRVVSVGDINYDLAYNKLPGRFFARLHPPGEHIRGELYRAAGGTAAIFALRAQKAGFKQCSVLGVIGGDALGKSIEEELHQKGIRTLLPADYNRRTSIALVLRDEGEKDTLLTLTDAHQALSEDDVNRAESEIKKAHLVFVSGYCLTDPHRQQAALKVMELAKEAGQSVVLDVTVDMNKALDFETFINMIQYKVDVLVAEIPTILAWLHKEDHQQDEWSFILEEIVPYLRQYFPTLFLRTSIYSYEIIASPTGIIGPVELDYSRRTSNQRLGYADEKTAQHLYQFMSPRLLLASKSPRRYELLKQIVAGNKIEVMVSRIEETYQNEKPETRVKRLALAKAQRVLSKHRESNPTSSIEIAIGADTEIVLKGEALGKPQDDETARQLLRSLSGQTHQAVTGLALIDTRDKREIVDCVSTEVKFKKLSEQEIEEYVKSGEPIGKAGAYGIQGKGALFIEEIDGSYSNVVGLPLERLSDLLDQEFGMPIWDIDKVSNWKIRHR
jgi:septum formation protein